MNKIIKLLFASAIVGGMGSCSSNYLDQPPIDLVSDNAIGESVEAARAALYGLCESMYISYGDEDSDYAIRFASGEAYFQTYYGDSPSPDFADSFLYGSQKENQAWVYMTRDTGDGDRYPWMYAYNLINQANVILSKIDNVPGDPADVKFIKAEALTIRAHAYIRLMQVYGTRFEDSQNGSALCVVLRTEPGSGSAPLATYKEVMEQIYTDLDDAIELFTESGRSRSKGFEPNIDVARGLYSRAALINHDWALAEKMAHDARAKYPIMSPAEYLAGFADANGEWLWYNDFNKTYNGYNSWGASFSCNGAYAVSYDWSGAGCISWRLYKEVFDKYEDDVRCELFWTPDKANMYVNYGFKDEDFWSSKYVYPARMTMWNVDPTMTMAATLWNMYGTPEGYQGGMLPFNFTFGEYLGLTPNLAANPTVIDQVFQIAQQAVGNTRIQFGAQQKFWSDNMALGDAQHPFLRGAELLLNEAEAMIEQGNYTGAQDCLKELNKQRIGGYRCTATGDALRDEVRLYRRIELWGEGDSWFSFKRWNMPVKREIWKEGDPTSNNFMPAYEGSYDASYSNGWRYEIPKSEKDYNTVINQQLNK